MNTGTIATKICDMGLDIQKIFKKITKLEGTNENLYQIINNEISQRQNLEKHSITSLEAFSGQLNALKNTYDHFEEAVSANMEKNRTTILEEVQKKNTNLIQLFESNLNAEKINSFQKNTSTLNDNEHSYIEKNEQQIELKFSQIEEMLTNEFKQYRSELNANVVKIECIDKKFTDSFNSMKNDFINLSKEINFVKKDIEQLKSFRKTTVQNFQNFQKDFIKNDEIISQFSNKIDSLINDIEAKMKNYDDIFQNHTNNFEIIKNDVFTQFKEMNSNLATKIKSLNDSSNTQFESHNKEIDNFEKHILNEHEKFISFIQNHLDEQNVNMKKLFDYVNDDIDILKGKNDSMENLIKKLRADVFKSINETEDFLQKKYESIFRIVNKN